MTDILINPQIYKKYDIRGKAVGDDADLTKEIAYFIGQGIGTYLNRFKQIKRVVVGRDNRHTSYDLQKALIEGLKRASCNVIDIGLVSTPLVYWHAVHEGNIGGIMVTGSHLAPEYNGFKMCIGNRNIYGSEIKIIAGLISEKKFSYGAGDVKSNQSAYSQYVHDLRERIDIPRTLNVVVDAGNGTGGLFAPRLMQLWQQNMTGLYIQLDGSYPNHAPNPQEAANMQALGDKVREVKADIGIAFDGDADRMGAVDENGVMIPADRILALLARDMLKRHPGAAVVADVLSSQVVFDVVNVMKGKAYTAPSGHSMVKDMMHEKQALLGGEMSGHLFLAENYFGFDDGYFAAGRVLQLLANSHKTLSQLNDELPHYYSTPEYRPHCPDADKQTVIAGVAHALQDEGKIDTIDGVRITFKNGWGILRASNTEPVLSMRFEGRTEADAIQYRDLFLKALQQFPQVEPVAV